MRIIALAALVAAVVTAACTQTVPPISFSIMSLPVMPLSHLVDTENEPIVMPAATGGKGTVSYALAPAVPGLTFDPATRTLPGTPTAVGDHALIYTATDEVGSMQAITFTLTAVPLHRGTWYPKSKEQ